MRIGEMVKEVNLSADTLRYYEKIGLIPPIKRNSGNVREYNKNDIEWIQFIKCMRKAGLSIDDVINYVDLVKAEASIEDRLEILQNKKQEFTEQIEELEQTMGYLDYKINLYEEMLDEVKK